MKAARTLLALIGLLALVATYMTGSLYFLIAAVGAFFAGIYMMKAHKSSRNPPPIDRAKSAPRKYKKAAR